MTRRSLRPIALTIAGSDSGGGAGIQADLRTFQAFGVLGCSAITAVTAQNTLGVQAVQSLGTNNVRAQIRSVLSDLPVSAIKLGMLAVPALAKMVAAELDATADIPVVCDPVLIATTGARLTDHAVLPIYRERLLPRCQLLTPNLVEAEALLDTPIRTRANMLNAARALQAMGARAVLLKGGHLAGSHVHDLLLDTNGEVIWFSTAKLKRRGHGTGCTLASAVAAGLAKRQSVRHAVTEGIQYMRNHFGRSGALGQGKLSLVLPY